MRSCHRCKALKRNHCLFSCELGFAVITKRRKLSTFNETIDEPFTKDNCPKPLTIKKLVELSL